MEKIKSILKSIYLRFKKKHENKSMAALAYVLFFVPLLTGYTKKDNFIKFHVQQGEVLFILFSTTAFFDFIKPWYWDLVDIIISILYFCYLVLMIIGIFNIMKDKKKPLPVIGKYAKYLEF